MTARRHPFFTSARGRLLSFNLLMGVVTLLVSGVAVFGSHHASQLREQVQRQTLNDMRGSMDLARDTANVATAAVRLSQVVGGAGVQKRSGTAAGDAAGAEALAGPAGGGPAGAAGQARVASIRRRSGSAAAERG